MKQEDLPVVWAYTNAVIDTFKVPDTEIKCQMAMSVWMDVLGQYELPIIKSAILERAKESDFFNIAKVGQTCEKLTQIAMGLYIDEEEVLDEIRKAVSYANCKENFQGLSEFAKEIVGHSAYLAKWAMSDQFETVIINNLRKKIHSRVESKKYDKVLEQIEIKDTKKLIEV